MKLDIGEKKKIETKEKAVLNQFFPRNCVALMCVLTGVLALSVSKRNVKYVLRMQVSCPQKKVG